MIKPREAFFKALWPGNAYNEFIAKQYDAGIEAAIEAASEIERDLYRRMFNQPLMTKEDLGL